MPFEEGFTALDGHLWLSGIFSSRFIDCARWAALLSNGRSRCEPSGPPTLQTARCLVEDCGCLACSHRHEMRAVHPPQTVTSINVTLQRRLNRRLCVVEHSFFSSTVHVELRLFALTKLGLLEHLADEGGSKQGNRDCDGIAG